MPPAKRRNSSMSEDIQGSDVFEQRWLPRAYLKQYYATNHLPQDEVAIFRYVIDLLHASNRIFARAIDVGCGPTIHHSIPLAPYVQELHLADYLQSNLDEVQKWLCNEEAAHDWDMYLRTVLEMEGHEDVHSKLIERRKQLIRSVVKSVRKADLRKHDPLGYNQTYDLVLSFYCADSATSSRREWRMLMNHLFNLVAPGGTLIISALRQTHHYSIDGEHFPSANVHEDDIFSVLMAAQFEPATIDVQVVHVPEWGDEGFSGITIAKAQRS
jgi:hypothetical protein